MVRRSSLFDGDGGAYARDRKAIRTIEYHNRR